MKLLNDVGLKYLIDRIMTMFNKKADIQYVDSKVKTDVPASAKFTGVITGRTESALNTGDEWHREM